MAMIDLDKLQSALKSVSDTRAVWESAADKLSELSPDVDMTRQNELMTAVSDAEQKYHCATADLAHRILALARDAEANGR